MLEDLDSDQVIELRHRALEAPKVAAEQALSRQGWSSLGQLLECLLRHVESEEVQPGIQERNVIAPITAANVEADSVGGKGVCLDDLDNCIYERQRRLACVPLIAILRVPPGSDQPAVDDTLSAIFL
jgi:hypothetical protein